jgi:hypothetical protein
MVGDDRMRCTRGALENALVDAGTRMMGMTRTTCDASGVHFPMFMTMLERMRWALN